jgi:hypothetical protein
MFDRPGYRISLHLEHLLPPPVAWIQGVRALFYAVEVSGLRTSPGPNPES